MTVFRTIVAVLGLIGIAASWIVAGLALMSAADGVAVGKAAAQGGLGVLSSYLAAKLFLSLKDPSA